jgi:hypothetical protein
MSVPRTLRSTHNSAATESMDPPAHSSGSVHGQAAKLAIPPSTRRAPVTAEPTQSRRSMLSRSRSGPCEIRRRSAPAVSD